MNAADRDTLAHAADLLLGLADDLRASESVPGRGWVLDNAEARAAFAEYTDLVETAGRLARIAMPANACLARPGEVIPIPTSAVRPIEWLRGNTPSQEPHE